MATPPVVPGEPPADIPAPSQGISIWLKIKAILGIITSLLDKGHDIGLWDQNDSPISNAVDLSNHLSSR